MLARTTISPVDTDFGSFGPWPLAGRCAILTRMPKGLVHALLASLALAGVSTLGDFVWATWLPEHKAVFGLIHGALLGAAIGLALGLARGRALP